MFDPRTHQPSGLSTFEVFRKNDESGVSGTGKVLEGVVFSDGTTVVRWCTKKASNSTTVFSNEGEMTGWFKFMDVHINSHDNEVTIQFDAYGFGSSTWHQPKRGT